MLNHFNTMPALLRVGAPCEPSNHPGSVCARIVPIAFDSLVPHIAQNASSLRDRLLFPAGSTRSGVVVLRSALHLGDLAESGGVGLLFDVDVRE